MKLKEFMGVLKEAAAYTKEGPQGYAGKTATSCGPSYDGGIRCQCCLTADGEVSAEQTGITISFTVSPTK